MDDYRIEAASKAEWAERALRAEAKAQDMALELIAVNEEADAAEAKLAKAVEALESICFTSVGDEGIYTARHALAELKGEDRG
jgi:hypothetical protein